MPNYDEYMKVNPGMYNKPTPEDIGAVPIHTNVNPNLIDNWYFPHPVNQRGESSYSNQGYGIDRWKSSNAYYTMTLASGGIQLTATTYPMYIQNNFEFPEELFGKTMTLSMLLADGNLYSVTKKTANQFNNTIQMSVSAPSGLMFRLSFGNETAKSAFVMLSGVAGVTDKVVAVKLEYGNHQTLAHQENGVWVLNEVPSYLEQLRRCQRFLLDLNPTRQAYVPIGVVNREAASSAFITISTPVSMRTSGPASIIRSGDFRIQGASSNIMVTNPSFSIDRITNSYVKLSTTSFGANVPTWFTSVMTTGGTVSTLLVSKEF